MPSPRVFPYPSLCFCRLPLVTVFSGCPSVGLPPCSTRFSPGTVLSKHGMLSLYLPPPSLPPSLRLSLSLLLPLRPGAFRTPLSATDAYGHRSVRFSFESSLAPFSLTFALFQPAAAAAAAAVAPPAWSPPAAEAAVAATVVGTAAGGWGRVVEDHVSTSERWLR